MQYNLYILVYYFDGGHPKLVFLALPLVNYIYPKKISLLSQLYISQKRTSLLIVYIILFFNFSYFLERKKKELEISCLLTCSFF